MKMAKQYLPYKAPTPVSTKKRCYACGEEMAGTKRADRVKAIYEQKYSMLNPLIQEAINILAETNIEDRRKGRLGINASKITDQELTWSGNTQVPLVCSVCVNVANRKALHDFLTVMKR
jgi:hypothetical protein